MIDLTRVMGQTKEPHREVDGRISTGEETPHHGLLRPRSSTEMQEIPPQTLQIHIQHIAGEIALVLVDGRPTTCYRLRHDTDWRVRAAPPNNPALTGGAARRTTSPVLGAGLSGYLRDTDTAPEGA